MSGPAYQRIEHHNRFSYSNILDRPRYDWPNGKQIEKSTEKVTPQCSFWCKNPKTKSFD